MPLLGGRADCCKAGSMLEAVLGGRVALMRLPNTSLQRTRSARFARVGSPLSSIPLDDGRVTRCAGLLAVCAVLAFGCSSVPSRPAPPLDELLSLEWKDFDGKLTPAGNVVTVALHNRGATGLDLCLIDHGVSVWTGSAESENWGPLVMS
jgi:hypothetical protein